MVISLAVQGSHDVHSGVRVKPVPNKDLIRLDSADS